MINNSNKDIREVEESQGALISYQSQDQYEASVPLDQEAVDIEIKDLEMRNISVIEIYKTIVDTRKFEIDNFWKRTLFFWGVLALILAGYINVKENKEYLIFISYFGLFYNVIFCLSIRGSKYWQEHWEHIARLYECGIKFKVFRWDVTKKIENDNSGVFPTLRPFRVSVSKLTMILSDITSLLWVLLIIKDLKYLIENNFLHFNLNCFLKIKNKLLCDFDFFTFIVVIIPIIINANQGLKTR